jgi:DNA-binding NarL/FixJ family response regulator
MSALRLWIDAPDVFLRRGLTACLGDRGFSVAGETAGFDPPPPLDGVDVLLFDAGGLDGAVALDRPPSVALLALSAGASADAVMLMLGSGVAGVVARDGLSADGLAAAIQTVAAGSTCVPRCVAGALAQAGVAADPAGPTAAGGLHVREVDVLRLLADGGSTTDIASELAYSERTVKNIVHDVMSKLGCRTRAHAVALATRRGVI